MNNYTYLYHYNKGNIDNFLVNPKNTSYRYLPLEDVFCLIGLSTKLSFDEITKLFCSMNYSKKFDINRVKDYDQEAIIDKFHYIGNPILEDYSKYLEIDSLFELKYNLSKLVLDPEIEGMKPIFIGDYEFSNMGKIINPMIRKKTFTTFKKIDRNTINLI